MDKSRLLEIRKKLKGKTLFVIPYMHADWAWCHTRQWHARRYISVFEDVIALMEKGCGYHWYMDCFCTELAPVLERKPDLLPKIRKYAERGDIQICGGFSNVRPNMVGDEAYVRNMKIGRERFHRYFPDAPIIVQAEAVDTALGHPQIPQLLVKGGFRYYRAGRPFEVLEKKGFPREFIWEGLDGSAVPVCWGEYGGMYLPESVRRMGELLDDQDALVEYLYDAELERLLRSSSVDILWVPQGCDDVLPLKALNADIDVPMPEIITRWNQSEGSSMRFAGPNEFFAELEKRRDRIMTHHGTVEICDVCYNVAWGGECGLITRRLQSAERIVEAEMWMEAAKLAAGVTPADTTPLWENSLRASAHATAWLFTGDFDEIYALAEKTISDAEWQRNHAMRQLAECIAKTDQALCILFNSHDHEVDDVIDLTIPFGSLDKLTLRDGTGRSLPFQALRPYEYTDSVWEHEIAVRVKVPALGWTVVSAEGEKLDCRHGAQYHRPLHPDIKPASEPFDMDNGVLRLHFENGKLISIYDNTVGRFISRDGDCAFNELIFTKIDTDQGPLHAGPIEYENRVEFTSWTMLEKGPIRWRVLLKGSDGKLEYCQTLTLAADSREVIFDVDVDWTIAQGYLRCAIPVSRDCKLFGGIPFGWELKDVDSEPYLTEEWNDIHRQWKGLFFAKDYVSARNGHDTVSLLGVCGDRYYRYDKDAHMLGYILINSVRMTEGTWEDNVNRRNMEGKGLHRFHYAIRADEADRPLCAIADAACELRLPLTHCLPYVGLTPPSLPSHGGMLTKEQGDVTVTAFYDDQGDTLVRTYETKGETGDVKLRFGAAFISCVSENFIGETDGRSVRVDGGCVSFHISPFEIVTLRLSRK